MTAWQVHVAKWLGIVLRRGRKPEAAAWCPGCGGNLMTNDSTFTDTDLVRYECSCGERSAWMFDSPAVFTVNDPDWTRKAP